MASDRAQMTVRPESELSVVLRQAAATGEPVVVDTGDAVYVLAVQPASDGVTTPAADAEPDAILGIIGIGSSDETTNIARDKDRYVADALDPRQS